MFKFKVSREPCPIPDSGWNPPSSRRGRHVSAFLTRSGLTPASASASPGFLRVSLSLLRASPNVLLVSPYQGASSLGLGYPSSRMTLS